MSVTAPVPFQLDEALAVLRASPAGLAALLRPLPPRMLTVNEGPGPWSPLDVLRHIVWAEVDDWMPRARLIVEQGPVTPFQPFDREAGFHRYAGWTLDTLIDEIARLRAKNLAELERLLASPGALSKQGRHPELGLVTLRELIATWATHDVAHLTQIGRVLTRDLGRHAGPWRAFFRVLREEPAPSA
jgi:hypothetical protein